MPLEKTCSVDAYKANIRTEIRAGKSPAQATAIARRTIEEACKEEGKPVPESISKAKSKKPKSREYLESALEECRRLLPGWMYAVIHRAALPKSGGNASRNRRMSAAEKAWIDGVESLSNPEIESAMRQLASAQTSRQRKNMDSESVTRRMGYVAKEMKRRGIHDAVADVVIGAIEKDSPTHLPKGTKIEKGFVNGEPEGGMHAHGLDRRNDQTFDDGPHVHLFVVPGSGDVLLTLEDGHHAHVIKEGGDSTEMSGEHTHMVQSMSSPGVMMETKLGGMHDHDLMVETSGFGGLHTHTLKLADGTEIESLTPGEFVERFVNMEFFHSKPIHSSRQITDAMNEAQFLREQVFGGEPEFPTVEESIAMMAKGEKPPTPPMTAWEVRKLANGGAYCGLSDVDDSMLMKNPDKLNVEVGDIVEVTEDGVIAKHSDLSEPNCFDEAHTISMFADEVTKATRSVDFSGPRDAVLVFVSASPSPLEIARKESLIGPDGAVFQERYLAPMGLAKGDIATGFAIPVNCDPTDSDIDMWRDQLAKSLAMYSRAKVVALGRVAKKALGPIASFSMPHPAAIRRHGDSGEVERKIRSICKALDISNSGTETQSSSKGNPIHGEPGTNLADSISELSKGGSLRVAVTKSADEKQIVYGVILDPYQVDLHNDWIPPAEIETTAHDFLSKSRVVGLRHKGVADAEVVESWVEVYPTDKDRELALQNLPHKVWRRQFGTTTINSGAWVAGVKLSDELWETHKKGELDAFSIGGFSFKTQISTDAMPEVEFVDLSPSS